MPSEDSTQPLVSVICFCKDRVDLIGRCIQSVLKQTYRNIEFVVQDGASTDGTLELLHSHAERDARVKIVSAPDSGPAEAYWKVLHRCRGEYIATCLSDEELVPDAIEQAVGWFAAAPTVGAFTCDGYTTDAQGKIIGEFKAGDFDFVAYLFDRYCPFWPGSFFRRQALLDIGLDRPGWNIGCLEFEIWCRLAQDHEVRYVPQPVSKYAIHPGQLSNTPQNFHEHIDNRLKLIERMFSINGFFGSGRLREAEMKIDLDHDLRLEHWFHEIEAKINQLSQFEFHARAHELHDEERGFTERIQALKQTALSYHDHNVTVLRRASRDPEISKHARKERTLRELWRGWEATVGVPRHAKLTDHKLRFKLSVQRVLTEHMLWRRPQPVARAVGLARRLGLNESSCPEFREFARNQRARRQAQMHDTAARVYESRGQIREALAMWKRAEILGDAAIDSMACQAALKEPEATYESIAGLQQQWVDRHIRVTSSVPPRFAPFDGSRKLRVGYHCSFMDADTIRYIMRRAIMAHDRSKLEVVGYAHAHSDLPDDVRMAFDVVRRTSGMSDPNFLQLVRRDRIDVFVELSGFSPGHRFGAMANRCAPVQISYLNHFATSRVPNVDYILSDKICTPPSSDVQRTFSEKIFLLSHCLLCYDYTDDQSPPIIDPPSLTTGTVTFGCFGSGGKINTRIVEIWGELMQRVPNSRMLIQNSQLNTSDNRRYMVDRFRRSGISPERIRLRPGADRATILRTYGEVDISLDTWPYGGGNTVAESLWQGVPVVTLMGERFSSRYGASLLQAAGCADLITKTRQDYIEAAAALAGNPARLQNLRHSLRQIYSEGGLNDSTRFARDLEQAYFEMMGAQAGSQDKTARDTEKTEERA
ncbi:MAG: glycosyltransferase [Enhydrobacter sp.]|nr:MAG: glycosyltransferase [Enhydrobacter sp.]